METIAACENICRDFFWLGPVTEWFRNVAIIIGVIVGWRQFESWRVEARTRRKAEVAEALIASTLDVQDAFDHIRNPMDSIPREKVNDKVYRYQTRFDRLRSKNELFQNLRKNQITVRVLIGDTKIDEAIETLFKSRNRVAIAFEILAEYADDPPEDKSGRDHKVKLRRDAYAHQSESDEIGKNIAGAVAVIESRLISIARYE